MSHHLLLLRLYIGSIVIFKELRLKHTKAHIHIMPDVTGDANRSITWWYRLCGTTPQKTAS